jgi:hypothetical protein
MERKNRYKLKSVPMFFLFKTALAHLEIDFYTRRIT